MQHSAIKQVALVHSAVVVQSMAAEDQRLSSYSKASLLCD